MFFPRPRLGGRLLLSPLALLLRALVLMTPVECQQEPSPPNYFFNCSENLLVTSRNSNATAALFNINTNTTTNVADISDSPGLRYRQAAIDDVSGTLYLRFPQTISTGPIPVTVTKFARYNTTNSDLLDAEPFLVVSGLVLSGHEFVDGDIYFVAGEPTRLVQAQVNETANSQGDATLKILDNIVVDLSALDGGPLAWDSCTSTMYCSTRDQELLAIDITSGSVQSSLGITLEADGTVFTVRFRDITVGPGPDCVLYGVIDRLFLGNNPDETLAGWVAMIDPDTGGVTPLADSEAEGQFDGATGIASCSNPPPPVTPPDNKCYVNPYYPSKMYDSNSFLEGCYYDLGDICAHDGGSHDDSQHASANEQQELVDTSASSSLLLRARGGTFKVCCYTNNGDAYKNKKTIIVDDGGSPNCVMCDMCSTPQEVNDHCCSQARRHHGHYGGCKSKMGNDYVCCKCAHGYTCAHKSGNCETACMY